MSGQIFISYRREESRWSARSLYDRLSARFDREQIFMDIDAIALGDDFVKAIEKTVGECDVLIAVIGAHWLTSRDEQDSRRLDNPEDFVRREIATALKRDIRVIPVLVDGASMPRSTDLPDDLKPLVRRNALRVTDTGFDDDCRRLAAAIEQVLEKTTAEQRGPEEMERLEAEQRDKHNLEAKQRETDRLKGGDSQPQEFRNALKENIAAAGRPTSAPATPTPSALPPPPPPPPPPKQRLRVGAILGGALIIALGIFAAIHFGGSGSTTLGTSTPSVGVATPRPSPTAARTAVIVLTPTPTPPIAVAIPTVAEPTATPAPAPQTNEQLAKTYFDLAPAEVDKKNYQAAIADYTEAIRFKPDYAEAYAGRGYAYRELNQYDKGISDYTEAIRLKPDYAEAYGNRGFAYLFLHQYDKALSDCNEAIRLKPDDSMGYFIRSLVYDRLGNSAMAELDRKKLEEFHIRDSKLIDSMR